MGRTPSSAEVAQASGRKVLTHADHGDRPLRRRQAIGLGLPPEGSSLSRPLADSSVAARTCPDCRDAVPLGTRCIGQV